MIISEHWLREWVDIQLDVRDLVDRLTMSGLEVDSIQRAGPELPDVVVGRVEEVRPHPDTHRLTVCEVDVGRRSRLTVVCGATNVFAGAFVPTALPDAKLPNGMMIAPTSVRRILSQGMLCSATELGLEDKSDGLYLLDHDAEIGQRVDEYLKLSDCVIDIDLTPNRGDCLSILGIARECAALTGSTLNITDVPGIEAETNVAIDIAVLDSQRCPRYMGRIVEDIDREVVTPIWMRERLRRCGVRPIHPVVDVTNYIMLELGQPMHAFDLERLRGSITVRLAKPGETIILLDGSELRPDGETLVIADQQQAIAVAGIMGGADSSIDTGTRHIVLEAAHFTPRSVAGKARGFGLSSDSAYRFERGVDAELPYPAIHYATTLLKRIVRGKPGPIVDKSALRHVPKRRPVRVRHARVEQLLGMRMDVKQVESVLRRVTSKTRRYENSWKVTPPSYRFDIERECDLIEELIRVHGYDHVPVSVPKSSATTGTISDSKLSISRIRSLLTDRDYQEVITYSFVDSSLNNLFLEDQNPIRIANPIADNMSELRTTLWPGLLQALITNLNRQYRRVRLFEFGRTFHLRGGQRHEVSQLGGVVSGSVIEEQWAQDSRAVDFFDVKADIEAILALTGANNRFIFNLLDKTGMQPGQSAAISDGDRSVGVLGRIHPRVQSGLDIDAPVYLFQLDLEMLRQRRIPKFTKPSRFPAIHRDLSVIVDNGVNAGSILDAVIEAGGKRIVNLNLFDVYRGEGIDPRRKSLAFGLTLRDSSRTLTDDEVENTISKIIDALDRRFGAQLRSKE